MTILVIIRSRRNPSPGPSANRNGGIQLRRAALERVRAGVGRRSVIATVAGDSSAAGSEPRRETSACQPPAATAAPRRRPSPMRTSNWRRHSRPSGPGEEKRPASASPGIASTASGTWRASAQIARRRRFQRASASSGEYRQKLGMLAAQPHVDGAPAFLFVHEVGGALDVDVADCGTRLVDEADAGLPQPVPENRCRRAISRRH